MYTIYKHSSSSQHISVLTTCTFMFRQVCTIEPSFFNAASGMHRRPFEGRHLVNNCNILYIYIIYTLFPYLSSPIFKHVANGGIPLRQHSCNMRLSTLLPGPSELVQHEATCCIQHAVKIACNSLCVEIRLCRLQHVAVLLQWNAAFRSLIACIN